MARILLKELIALKKNRSLTTHEKLDQLIDTFITAIKREITDGEEQEPVTAAGEHD